MALNPLVSLIGRLLARSGRKRGNRQTDGQTDGRNDKTTTVTLAAHARRGLIRVSYRRVVNAIRKHSDGTWNIWQCTFNTHLPMTCNDTK